ncbi:MAG: hypothetical protein G01um101472_258 [Parcubacteria group bacterium Gr01-1014_72]|nr:MAG: hypothetical protein G01um101472_258 [Parcubacteria group bacterium Gr01-1014_72]
MNFESLWFAILLSAVATEALGMLWYSPALFGRAWARLSGLTDEALVAQKAKGMAKSYLLAFLGAFVTAFVLSYLFVYLNVATFVGGLELAALLWFGLIAPVMLPSVLWEGKSWLLYSINALYYLMALFLTALILTAWL